MKYLYVKLADPLARSGKYLAQKACRNRLPRVASVPAKADKDVLLNVPKIALAPDRAQLMEELMAHIRKYTADHTAERWAAIKGLLGRIQDYEKYARQATEGQAGPSEILRPDTKKPETANLQKDKKGRFQTYSL